MHIDFRRKSTLLLAGCLVLGSMHFPGTNVQASTVANGTSYAEADIATYTVTESGTAEITYNAADLKTYGRWSGTEVPLTNGKNILTFSQQYEEFCCDLPEALDMSKCQSITIRTADQGGTLCFKVYDADKKELKAYYGNSGNTEYTFTPDYEGIASTIAIMSNSDTDTYPYTTELVSITFVMDAATDDSNKAYNAADLKTYGRWSGTEVPLTNGKNILTFSQQYEEFCCDLPEALDMSKCQSITFRTADQGGTLCFKVYNAAKDELKAYYGNSGKTEYTFTPDFEGMASTIAVMSNSDTDTYPYTTELVSVTFVMDTAADDDSDIPMGDNLIKNPNFADADADALSVWTAASGSATVTSETAENAIVDDIKTYGKISRRASNYECIAQDITNAVINNKDYQYSFYIMLDANDYKYAPEEMRTVEVSPIKTVGGETFYSQDVSGDTKKVLEPGVWTKFTGILSPSWSKDATLEKLVLRIIEQGTNYGQGEGIKGAYYVTGVELREIIQPNKEVQTDIPDLHAEVTKEMGEDFIMGTSICNSDLADELTMQLVTKHFNAITLGNELKPDAMFGYAGTCPATETVTINGTELVVPKMDFSRAEKTLDYIYDWNQNHPENTIRVRGHVLVWHSQTPEWFFHEDYDKEKDYVDKDTMNLRLEWYIKSVAEHFTGPNSKYKDMFYGWDVVNEAVSDGTGTYRNDSENSSWWAVYKSNEFILNAFVFANKYMPESIELYYNDYNEWFTSKTNGIVQLLKDVKATEGARIDGMGMQGHYQTSGTPTIDEFEKAVRAYYEVVGKVQITELDFKATSDYDGTKKTQEAEFKKLAERYKAIYNSVRRLNEDGILIDNITVWGVIDKNSWLQTAGNVGGASDGRQKQCPLLFDDYYQAKDAYWVFVNPEPLTPSIKKLTIVQTKKDSFAPGVEQTFTRKNTAVSFTPVWNETGISVQVNVADTVNDATDKVTLYLSDAEGKIYSADCLRADAKETAEGYTAIVNIALDSSLLKTASSIGFDLVVTNGNEQLAYNDTTLTQATSSSYFAIATLKPYMAIQKGTAAVDGKAETDWDKAEAVPLTINLGSNVTANAKLLWDEKNLYILAEVKDSVLNSDSTNAHEKDSLEIFIDENNHKSTAYEEDDKQYRINYLNEQTFNGKKCLAENIESAVSLTEDGYIIEAAIQWTDIAPEADTEIGLELQINDADETGKRIGTLSWYDQTGKGWSAPEVFGTVILKDYSSVPALSTPADYADGLAALLEDAYVSEEYLVEYAESFRESVISDKANLPEDASERQKLLEEYEKLIAQATNSQVKIVSKDPGISTDKVTIIGALLNITAGKDGSLNIHEKVTDKLPGLESYTNICAFDLTLWQDDTEVALSIPVILSIPLPEGISTVNLKILHYANGDDKAPLIIEPTLVDGKIVFEAEHFSTFVIANIASSNQNSGSNTENNNQNNNQNQNNDPNQSNNQNNDQKTDSSASVNPAVVNANVTSANTGDNAPIAEAVLLLFAAFVILAVYVKKKRA